MTRSGIEPRPPERRADARTTLLRRIGLRKIRSLPAAIMRRMFAETWDDVVTMNELTSVVAADQQALLNYYEKADG